jgi:hypothetical protein
MNIGGRIMLATSIRPRWNLPILPWFGLSVIGSWPRTYGSVAD